MKIKQRNNLGKYIKNGSYQRIGYGIGWLILLMGLLAFSAYYSASKPLVDPRVSLTVPQVLASEKNEIPKESTKAWKLYQLVRWYESNNGTQGLAVTCAKKGKVNEVGYLPYKGFCFKSEWDQELTTLQWFEKKLNNGWTIEETLCYWNTGRRMKTCAYAIGQLSKAN